ncbi:hypothetical protein FRC09_010877 [Ceratobasidium sp. 395]|nr:hypothetical protein FRC09_010877 [Ceratobasidium sp. 395]
MANTLGDRYPPLDRRLVEVKISIRVRDPTTVTAANGPNASHAYVPAGCYRHYPLLALAFGLAVAFLDLAQSAFWQLAECVPGTARVVPGRYLPVFKNLSDVKNARGTTTVADSNHLPARHHKARSVVAQAPICNEMQSGYHHAFSVGFFPYEDGTRGLSSSVVQAAESCDYSTAGRFGSEPPGRHVWQHSELEDLELAPSPRSTRNLCYRGIEDVLVQASVDLGFTPHDQLSSSYTPLLAPPCSPLTKTLVGWDLTKLAARLLVLAVGVGGEDLPGPNHDVQWLGRLLSAAMFYAPKGPRATKKAIRSALEHMFENAASGAVLSRGCTEKNARPEVTWCFGGGGPPQFPFLALWSDRPQKITENSHILCHYLIKFMSLKGCMLDIRVRNRFVPPNQETGGDPPPPKHQSIDESTLFQWIDELRTTTGKCLPAFLAFDFCRENEDIPPVSTDQLEQVYIIWACMPGQSSFDIKLDDGLPYSNLLKAVCLALAKIQPRTIEGSPHCFMGEILGAALLGMTAVAIPVKTVNYARTQTIRKASRPSKIPSVGFRGSGVDTNKVVQAVRPVLDCLLEPVQQVATNITSNKWYLKFVAQDIVDRPPAPNERALQPRGSSAAISVASLPPPPSFGQLNRSRVRL